MRKMAIVVTTYNNAPMLTALLSKLSSHQSGQDVYTIVVNHGSTDRTRHVLADWRESGSRRSVVTLPTNSGNSGHAANEGMKLLLDWDEIKDVDFVNMSDDIIPLPFLIDNLAQTLDADDKVGIVGCKLLYPSGRIQHAGAIINGNFDGIHLGRGCLPIEYQDVGACRLILRPEFVTGALFAIRNATARETSVFDTAFEYYNDADLCWRAEKLGWKVVYNPFAQAVHGEGMTWKKVGFEEHTKLVEINKSKFIERYGTSW